jgi:thiopeptide-type bacteriocin biosynthesis protein
VKAPSDQPSFGFEPAGFVILRTPLRPFDDFIRWGEGLRASLAPPERGSDDAWVEADCHLARQRLAAFFADGMVRAGLRIASPAVAAGIDGWLRKPDSESGRKVERALVRYFTRMCGRCTPFGMFAGYSLGAVGGGTELRIESRAGYRRVSRLNLVYLSRALETLARVPAVRERLRFWPSATLRLIAGRWKYDEVERSFDETSGQLRHQEREATLEPSPALDAVLAEAAVGVRLDQLVRMLVREHAADRTEAIEFVEELVRTQVLVPELAPAVLGESPVVEASTFLEHLEVEPARKAVAALRALSEERAAIDQAGVEAEAPEEPLRKRVAELVPGPQRMPLLQVDLIKPAPSLRLGDEIIGEISRGIHVLHRLFAREPSAVDPLRRFREAFVKRYEQREVPLLEALDDEVGIGFPAATPPSRKAEVLTFAVDARVQGLARYVFEAVAKGRREVVLEEHDLKRFASGVQVSLPESFHVMAAVGSASHDALARGEFQVFVGGAGGPSGVRLLARFAHGDPELREAVARCVTAEQRLHPGAIVAEVGYLPSPTLGNTVARPSMRDYVIPISGGVDVPPDRRIALSDLWVLVRGGRIVLRSQRLGVEVIPRHTTAHGYQFSTAPAAYRFLCDLQRQDVSSLIAWSWEGLTHLPFLPRVRHGRVILTLARWRLFTDELSALSSARLAERMAAVERLREGRGLPRWVTVVEGENDFPVDLQNPLSVSSFSDLVAGRPHVDVRELFPEPDAMLSVGPEGRFAHELLVPFMRRTPTEHAPIEPPPPVPASRRNFAPGSSWLYVKVYMHPALADRLLVDSLVPRLRRWAKATGGEWFFVRYADPELHLRLRLSGPPEALSRLLPSLRRALDAAIADRIVQRVQLDTYEREVERYGGLRGVVLAERLFHADSVAVAEWLRDGSEALAEPAARRKLATLGVHRLLTALRLDAAARLAVVTRLAGFARKEADLSDESIHGAAHSFRAHRPRLERMLVDPASEVPWAVPALERRERALAPVVQALARAEAAGELAVPVALLAESYAHMHVNRVLASEHAAQEFLVCDYLRRLYESAAARARSGPR